MKKPAPRHTIVWLHSHFLFWMGGTKYLYEVIKRLKSQIRIIVVVEQADELAKKMYQEIGVELVIWNTPTSTSPLYWLTLPWQLRSHRQRLQKLLLNRKLLPQHTTLVSSMFPMNTVTERFWPFRRVQLCYEPFAFFHDSQFIAAFPFWKHVAIQVLARHLAPLDIAATRAQERVLTLNSVTAETIAEVYGVSAVKVYAGVDATRFRPYVSHSLAKQYKNIPVSIHSTDFSPVKGTDRVIKAFALVSKKVKTAQLLITSTIANATAQQKLQDLADSLGVGKQVKFLGFVSLEELPQYYSLSRVLVQGSNSSRSGTTSMALPVKEALCCGTPAIRPDVGGEDVVDGVSGYLVDPEDTEKLAEKMGHLLQHESVARKMGRAGRVYVMGRYTWEKTVERVAKWCT
jgi:glycosyltransferase involved in cell wall biosynthesis